MRKNFGEVDAFGAASSRSRPESRSSPQAACSRVISTVDPEARHAHKTVSRRQDGFKAHLAIEPDTGLITDCALTKASGVAAGGQSISEPSVGLDLLDGEAEPVTVLGDSAYGSGQLRAELGARGHTDQVKPAPTRSATPGGFTVLEWLRAMEIIDSMLLVISIPALGSRETADFRPSPHQATQQDQIATAWAGFARRRWGADRHADAAVDLWSDPPDYAVL